MKKILTALLIIGLAAPAAAMAADASVYGQVWTHLGYYSVDEDYGPVSDSYTPYVGEADESDDGTSMYLGNNTRLGANFDVSDAVSGQIELRPVTDELRLAKGVWDFGGGKLIAGKDYAPNTLLYSGQILNEGCLLAYAPFKAAPTQMKLDIEGFQIALLEHNTAAGDQFIFYPKDPKANPDGVLIDDTEEKDFVLPRLNARYTLEMGDFSIVPTAAYWQYDIKGEDDQGDEQSETVESWLLGLGFTGQFDPAYVKAYATYGQNAGDYGYDRWTSNVYDGELEDSDIMQGVLVAGFNVNQQLAIEAGVGYKNQEGYDRHGEKEQTDMAYYVQAPYTLAEGLKLTPEIGMQDIGDTEYEDDDKDDEDGGSVTYMDVALVFSF